MTPETTRLRSVEKVAQSTTDEISHIVYEADGDKMQIIHDLLTDTITQDRQQVLGAVCGVINSLPGTLLPDTYSESPDIIHKEDAKTAIKNLLDVNK